MNKNFEKSSILVVPLFIPLLRPLPPQIFDEFLWHLMPLQACGFCFSLAQKQEEPRGPSETRQERKSKCTELSLHHWLVQASQQRKLQYKRKSWFQVHIWNVSVSPCACLISVQWHCFRKGLSDSSLWLQRCNTQPVVLSWCQLIKPGELLIWHLLKGTDWYWNMPLSAVFRWAFEACTFLCHTGF